jgi:UDP-N-acetylglucosamine 1-carboxyvinyltransferase
LSTVTAALREAGCRITADEGGIYCSNHGRLKAVGPIRTAPYPGFPTDAQAVLMAAMLRSRGITVFEENLFTSRYRHVDELIRMGADIRVFGRTAMVMGTEKLCGASVRCTDLRGGAALCVAALAAEGETTVTEIGHIDRGYEEIARDLRALGADVTRIEMNEERHDGKTQKFQSEAEKGKFWLPL